MITHRFTTFDPSLRLQRRDPVRAVLQFCWMRGLPFGQSCSPAAPLNFLSCGFPKNAPPLTYTVRVRSRLSLERAFLRLCAAKHRAPSVHVVPPDFDGFLRELRCRFVSSCSQPWGSSCFRRGLPPPVFPQQLVLHAFLRLAPHTLQSFSLSDSYSASPQALPSRRWSAPLFPVRFPRPQGLAPSSSPLSSGDVSISRLLDALLGFVPLQGAPLVPTAHLDISGVFPP